VKGYRGKASGGPRVRTDVVDVYIFRRTARTREARAAGSVEFLQLLRADEPLTGTWHPLMGHVERGETAAACAWRELGEEVGLRPDDAALVGLWALEQVHPYFIAAIDTIVLGPRFAAEVSAGWEPTLNDEHTAARWVPGAGAAELFMWPGQAAACREVVEFLLRVGEGGGGVTPGSSRERALRVGVPVPRRAKRAAGAGGRQAPEKAKRQGPGAKPTPGRGGA
jgi:ADP-ribose pyrophosphatase YjhB (NUDIX family)